MKNIIKQIEKIKGVVTVEKAGENMAVVVFEANPKSQEWAGREYVECKTKEQFEFIKKQNELNHRSQFEDWGKYPCVCVNGTEIFSSEALPERAHRVIDFDKYVLFFGLRDKWKEASKPKSLSPDELIDGKIYVMEGQSVHVFRYKNQKVDDSSFVSHYSYKCDNVKFMTGQICVYQSDRILRPATPSEAQSLIRTEIANNYFHELK